MRLHHKINHGWSVDRTDPGWSARVEHEATCQTDSRERAYLKAETKLARAEQRLSKARTSGTPDVSLTRLLCLVEQRRAELEALARLMQQSPAGSQHRGVGSYRGLANLSGTNRTATSS